VSDSGSAGAGGSVGVRGGVRVNLRSDVTDAADK
jgi:hypothetical protein